MTQRGLPDWTAIEFIRVGTMLTVFTLAVIALILLSRMQSAQYEHWVETPCEITWAGAMVQSPTDRGNPNRFTINVSYRYEVDGVQHEAEGFGAPEILDRSWTRADVLQFIRDGKTEGAPDRCLVDPDDPTRSVFRYVPAGETEQVMRISLWALAFFLAVIGYGVFRGLRDGWN